MFPLTSSSREKQEKNYVVIRLIEDGRNMQRTKEHS
jgi:hypothetical protein